MSRPPIRIAVLFFCHETVSFLPNDTTRADFISAESPASGDALLMWERDGYLGGFVQVAREHDGVSLAGIESPTGRAPVRARAGSRPMPTSISSVV